MTSKPQVGDPALPILIVDDNAQYSNLLRRILETGLGYCNITSVDNTDDAYKVIADNPGKFQMLFVDFRFPSGATGGQLLEKLKQDHLLNDKVAFLITSEPSADNVKQARAAGAVGVVAKPFDRAALKSQLDRAARAVFADEAEYF